MSPRAAWRLERMGFEAYDYTAGKADWIAAGWETERSEDAPKQARDALEADVPTCPPGTPVGELTELVERAGSVLVVNDDSVVLGRVRHQEVHDAPEKATAEEVMHPGPVTVRPLEPLDDLLHRMEHGGVTEVAVTTAEGVLLGVVRSRSG